MKKVTLAMAILALGIAGCANTLDKACKDHGGVRADSVEPENDGGAEARCNDNAEAENPDSASPQHKGWSVEE